MWGSEPWSYRDVNNEFFGIFSTNHDYDLSPTLCENPTKCSDINDEKDVRLPLSVKNLQGCTLEQKKDMKDKSASSVRSIKWEDVSSTYTGLHPEVDAQEKVTSQSHAAVQENLLSAFEYWNRQVCVHAQSHKKKLPTSNMR